MATWKSTLHVSSNLTKLLVTSADGDDLLKARLPARADHPRALLTILEGAALWSGQPLHTAIFIRDVAEGALGLGELETLWTRGSALVRLEWVGPHRRRRITGLGDFRQLRLLGREWR